MGELVLSSLNVFLALFLVLTNGLFVAAEFAFVRIRSTQVERLVEEGKATAPLVRDATTKLDAYLAVCQLGITISSLGLGWIGEPAVATLIAPLLESILPEGGIHAVSVAIGFGLITFLHVVFGELAPKTFSIQKPEGVSLVVAPFMKFFYYLFMPGIIVFNGAANLFTRSLGFAPASETQDTHTEEDIRMIIAQSQEQGVMESEEAEMIGGVFELGDTMAREIMVPRPDVITLQADMPLSKVMTIAAQENFTRYPVLDLEGGEQVLGAVHVKDVLRAAQSGKELTARDLVREVLVVPENRRIDDILADFQKQEIQMGIVIDEWGSFEGIVTIEDIIEEIVGEIRDEFDIEEPEIRRLESGAYSIDGRTLIQTVNEALDTDFESEDFETMGGLVLGYIGRAPEVGDTARIDGYTLTVDEVDGNRISHVILRHEPDREPGPQENEEG